MPVFPHIRRAAGPCILLLASAFAAAPLRAAAEAADASPLPPAGALAAPYRPDPEKTPPGMFVDDGAALGQSVAERRGIEVDADRIRAEQTRLLEEQSGGSATALYSATNRFTESIDRWHEKAFRWMDNSVRTMDLRWMAEREEYEPEFSTFAFSLLLRAGGRGNDGDFDARPRFDTDLALPGIERRLHIVFENAGRDDLPGADPMTRDDSIRLGVRTMWDSILGDRWDLGGGLRWRNHRPVGYVDLEWHWSHDFAGGRLRFVPRAVWYTDEGFGQDTTLHWTRPLGESTILQLVSAENSKETSSGLHLEETVRLAFLLSGKGRGWIFQASVFPYVLDSGHTYFDDILANVTWRDAFYRQWIYYTVTPQLDFASEDSHDPEPSLRIGFEILFGGATGNLL